MIILEKALKDRESNNNPIKVAMVGAGYMGQGIALQMHTAARGMRLVAISNRNIDKAKQAYCKSGVKEVEEVSSRSALNHAIKNKKAAVTTDPMLLCRSEEIEVIIEVTGTVQFSAGVVLEAVKNKKHVVLMNAELDGTVGPILKVYADKNDVIITNSDGDQPGVIMNLYRYVKSLGVKPVLCGNIKGLQDRYRNPTTQEAFAKKWDQKPEMVTSFADGSKVSYEQAVIANATGMKVGKRGMYGPTVPAGTPVEDIIDEYPKELLETKTGVVDYVVGASPAPGVFIIGRHDHPLHQKFLRFYKMGDGPYYCFYIPYHLCHFEVPVTVARAALFNLATIAPAGKPEVDVIAMAKKDLKAGEKIDGMGYYMIYGVCENSEVVNDEHLLPLGVAEDCILTTDIKKDQALSYDDVRVPEGRFIDELRREQKEYFSRQ